ncbi:MAG: DNA polymerase I [Desulfobacteraceae bacterium 4572_130]|nr:MAG: DNA polymerase I [Desulfobacteraceae bacterium 4572_130]
MKKTIYLIDGSAYVYRAFHAIKNLSSSKGVLTNATFGVTRIILKLIKEKQPEYAGIFFDVKGPTFRHKMYEKYKANRPPMPDDLILQIPYIKKIIKGFNIPIIEKKGFEADDLIGTYARIAEKENFFSVMVTGDKDFMQLVTDNTVIWDPMKDKLIDKNSIYEKFNISPEQIIDMLGLAGDSADNIPGVPGVGPKTSQKLINQFKTMEKIYENIDKLKSKKSLYKKLFENKNQAFLSRDLVVIDKNVNVKQNIKDFKLKPFNRKKLAEIFKELEFKKLFHEFSQKQNIKKNYSCLTDLKHIKNLVEKLKNKKTFAIDTETTSKYPMLADLVGISFSFKENQGLYIPLAHKNTENYNQPDIKKVIKLIKPLLENPKIKKIGQNIKYDYIVLFKYGIKMQGMFFDTMIASHLLNPSRRTHSLDTIAMDLFGYKIIKYEDIAGKGKKQKKFNDIKIEKAINYASEDADITFMSYKVLEKTIAQKKLKNLMKNVEMPLIKVLAHMEMQGIKIDNKKLEKLSINFKEKLSQIKKEIFSITKQEFNINSPKQLEEILFEKLKLPADKKTKKKTGYSTDIDVLKKLAQTHELPGKILEFRSLSKLKSTYSDALQNLNNPKTKRIHTSFNQTITATGRLSSSNPNLQNIPIKSKKGRQIRQAFIPKKGAVLVSADYSQIELRILSHYAKDKILINAFKNDEDIHTRTAKEVFQVLPGFITDDLRNQAKAINFGIIYGMSAFGLSKELEISRKMAQTYITSYFSRYNGVKKFIGKTIENTEKTGGVSTILGRKRRLNEINSSNINIKKFAQRAAVNTIIQGSAADLIKLAMINMDKALRENNMNSKMLISVHDEIIFETPENEEKDLIKLTKKIMENVFTLKVPLKVNIKSGANWADAH